MLPANDAPAYDADLYSDEAVEEPYGHYRAIRDLGPVVWLPRHEVFAIGRYDQVVEALRDHRTFSSKSGVAISEVTNGIAGGTTIASDPPEHDHLRRIVAAPLAVGAVGALRPQIENAAEEVVARLTAAGTFDAAADLAQHLPLTIVSHMVGLPEAGRQNMLAWASATFDLFGPENARTQAARPVALEMRNYVNQIVAQRDVKAESWADRLFGAADAGTIPPGQVASLLRDYLGPSLDTTIFATSSLIWLFGLHPDQWEMVCGDPSLIRNAINEAVRLESPIRAFTRRVTADTEIGGTRLPEGARVLLLYASANRDERRWEEPERFDVRRKVQGQVGFGLGVHSCAGMHLARLEIECLIKALIPRVHRFEVGTPVRATNNTLRGFASLPVKITARGGTPGLN
jgi:cytochrome P450